MREVTKDQFFATVGQMNVNPRSEKTASYWETPSRQLMGRTEPGYICEGPKRYFIASHLSAAPGEAGE